MKNRYNSANNSIVMPNIHQQSKYSYSQQQYSNTNSSNQYQFRVKNKYQPRTPPIIEIYDLEALELDTSSGISSLSSSSSSAELNRISIQKKNQSSPSSSASSSPRSSFENSSLYQSDSSYSDEPFTFQEFISSIINCNDKEWHKLIIQDLSRLLELKFRDFKKQLANVVRAENANGSAKISPNNTVSPSIYLNTESDLFTKIAEKIFELASEEPNGILGARIKLKLMCDGGKNYDICQSFPYDSSTMSTSEIVITIKEDITSFKKLLMAFKLYSNIGKYFSLHIDSNNFDIVKFRLY